MKVIVDSWAWIDKASLSELQLSRLRTNLTVVPRKAPEYPGEDPGPLYLYTETPELFGVAREYFLTNRKPHHEFVLNVANGDKSTWPGDLTFSGKLREEQGRAVAEISQRFKHGGLLGGMLKASPGWGKCSAISSTYVTLYPTGERCLLRDLIGQTPLVPSLDADGKIRTTQASQIWHAGTKECFRLTLFSGQWLEASFDHPVLTQRGWTKLGELQAGRETLVASARVAPVPERPLQISDSEVIVAGLYTADGSSLHHGAAIYVKGSETLVDLFETHVAQVPCFTGFGRKVYERGAWYVHPHGMPVWIRKWELDRASPFRRVPPRFFGLNQEQLALFLRAVWTDGNIYLKSPRKLELALASEGLIDDIQELLRRFGIVARKSYTPKKIKDKTFDAWRLQIADKENLLLFAEHVGAPFGMEAAFGTLVSVLATESTNTNWDVVPIGKAELREIRKSCRHLSSKVWVSLTQGRGRWLSRARFERLVAESGYTGEYAQYASSDLVWEAVRTVVPIGEQEVADLTVPGTENVIANGIVSHNTVASSALIAEMQVPTLVVVHKEFLMAQWRERLTSFLPGVRLGLVQQDECTYLGCHVVLAMVHTLANKTFPEHFMRWSGLVITDECHRIGAKTWSVVPAKFPARWRLGITATPRRKDGAEKVFQYHLGEILFAASEQRMKPKIRRVHTTFQVLKTAGFNPALMNKSILLKFLCSSQLRNRVVAMQVVMALQAGRKVLVLSERLNHLEALHKEIEVQWGSAAGPCPSIDYYVGGRKEKELAVASKAQVILATSQYAQEGLDIPALDTLVLSTPLSDVEQAVGRILRPFEGKKDPIVVDIRDDKVGLFRALGTKRDVIYERMT